MKKILVVEDDNLLRLGIKTLLENDYKVDEAKNAQEAIDLLQDYTYHLIITDMMMPGGNGDELLKYLQNENIMIDVFAISAISDDEKILSTYDLNVIDYIVKPINYEILKKKIDNLFKNKYGYTKEEVLLNKKENSLIIDSEKHEFTEKEFELLELLISFPNNVFSKYDLLNELWYGNMQMSDKIVEATISNIRNKLKGHKDLIKTKRGQGYYYEKKENF